ncbi:tRNA (adenine(22)-N(1))-methyltransferase [Clostridium cellulovorans]|uniref:SAM-dependent methyltransferase n=1 Tax=Clostridium cellulovorans (strain ATCC 35296 / DSM 3052 / OCM 3 / 743B) TaxID=573061 RepID=D9SW69_CLOC7|nr:class I SAM-dependent methyltransferase [Clostridium cellulovorans]ADL51213.1 protein of unknown function DUF633 [Clostridium cellulovorans 743B]
MELSKRLKTLAEMVDPVDSVADIGTDHGYVPIYLIKAGRCKRAIASDINKGPLDKSKENILRTGLQDKVQCRLGGGFQKLKPKEVDVAVIAGMGGNLIRDIIEADMEVFKNLKFCIVQPVQNPEVLRKYIYEKGFRVIEEKIVYDEGKYYQILKISYDNNTRELEDIEYEIGEFIIKDKNKDTVDYINYRLQQYINISSKIKDDTEASKERKREIEAKIIRLKEVLGDESI